MLGTNPVMLLRDPVAEMSRGSACRVVRFDSRRRGRLRGCRLRLHCAKFANVGTFLRWCAKELREIELLFRMGIAHYCILVFT